MGGMRTPGFVIDEVAELQRRIPLSPQTKRKISAASLLVSAYFPFGLHRPPQAAGMSERSDEIPVRVEGCGSASDEIPVRGG